MKIKKHTVRCASLTALLSSVAFAGTMGDPVAPWTSVVTLSGGPEWTDAGKTQSFYLQQDVLKTYSANKNTKTLGSGEVFLGLQGPVYPDILGQFGLALAGAGTAKLSGDIWEDGDPDFNNYTYRYKINHLRIAVKGKAIAPSWRGFAQPYIMGSVGVGINRAYDYSITPKIFEEVPSPFFTSNTRTSFSYTVGAGLQRPINDHIQVGLGYEFADWGKSKLWYAPLQAFHGGLGLGHLFTNQLQFSLSYVA